MGRAEGAPEAPKSEGRRPAIHILDPRRSRGSQPMEAILAGVSRLKRGDVLRVEPFQEGAPPFAHLEGAGCAAALERLHDGSSRLTIWRLR